MPKFIGGHYRIIKELGQGGFGKTFLAEDTHLPGNPICVVKQLMPINPGHFPIAKRLFDSEAQVLYKLGEHHNQIPKLFAHFEENQEFYLVQEFIDGDVFQEVIKGQKWNENQVIDFLEDILPVLDFIHQHNVIHRDLKPDNLIKRKKDNKIVLIDFGAVKEIMSQATYPNGESQKTISIGTAGYMPSEQSNGNPQPSSDIYALGMIAIQTLTGVSSPTHLTTNPNTHEINWRHSDIQISAKLAEILDKMIRYDFRQRYKSAREALQAIYELKNRPKVIVKKNKIRLLLLFLLAILVGAVVLTCSIYIKLPNNEVQTTPKREQPAF
jgi:eukaryotic-like serine/threonine-protein kinase